jgi:hypothetical protein
MWLLVLLLAGAGDNQIITLLDPEKNKNGSNANLHTKSTYMWKYDQVLGLINSMGNYTNYLDDPRKRKDIYEHVANELLSMKYEVNATMVQNKLKSLLKSYHKAKDNKRTEQEYITLKKEEAEKREKRHA